MQEDIQKAYQALRQAIVHFNEDWPQLATRCVVWRLPVLQENKTPDSIPVERLDGHVAIAAAKAAFLQFEREVGQAPGTVMRLPGVIFVSSGVLGRVEQINALKQAVKDAIEQTRIEQNVQPAIRPRIMRRALGKEFNTNQLLRSIQSFDAAPRLIVFTWAGHTGGTEYKVVAQVREQLELEAAARADREGVPVKQTVEYQELRSIVRMADDESLVKRKLVAPHPRAMLYLSESTTYDAMIHANLPVFVLDSEDGCEVRDLKDFDRSNRTAERPDCSKASGAVPRKSLYLPTDRKARVGRKLAVPSTYLGGVPPDDGS